MANPTLFILTLYIFPPAISRIGFCELSLQNDITLLYSSLITLTCPAVPLVLQTLSHHNSITPSLPLLLPLCISFTMSGVWIFDKNGVARLIRNPTRESFEQKEPPYPGTATAPGARPRVLIFLPANQVIRSYAELEQRLTELGWTRYQPNSLFRPDLVQFHRSENSAHLISLPTNFDHFKSFHMYDIVVKNRSFFEVRDPSAL